MDLEWRNVTALVKEARAIPVQKQNLDLIRELASRNPMLAVAGNGEQLSGYRTIAGNYKFFCAPLHDRVPTEWLIEFSNGDVEVIDNEQFTDMFGVLPDEE